MKKVIKKIKREIKKPLQDKKKKNCKRKVEEEAEKPVVVFFYLTFRFKNYSLSQSVFNTTVHSAISLKKKNIKILF